jgi:NAD+-dependent secondary alcohol dehydrogenase Adh1
VDPNAAALELASQLGAHHTVITDGTQVQQVAELTRGHAEAAPSAVDQITKANSSNAATRRLVGSSTANS